MPPALSEAEDSPSSEEQVPSSDEQIPPQRNKQGRPVKEVAPANSDESDDEEPAEDEYIVEKIISHRFKAGVLEFNVKWHGYDDPKERTWEPEANMEGAVDVMKEYFDELGGRPEPKDPKEPKGQKRKGRPSAVKSATGTPTTLTKRVKQEKQWSPPPGSWEHEVSHIDTVEESIVPKSGERMRFAYLVWNNQKKTQHPLRHVYQKCPQKMLLYYESHLVFTNSSNGANGDGSDDGNNVSMQDLD